MARNDFTQAVVIIHGIGEQRPMATVRSFVEALLPEPKRGPKYFSKPHPLAENFELRKLQNRKRPRTHFFELYWANEVEGTRLSHVTGWLANLLLRRPSQIPAGVRSLYWISWGLIVLALAAVAVALGGPTHGEAPWYIAGAATASWALVQWLVLGYVGDAARYLSPKPSNIALRQSIRTRGIELLRHLQDCGEYERIIVVGHSLGSVIGYDVLRYLWIETYETLDDARRSDQPALREAEMAGVALDGTPERLEAFQDAQGRAFAEYRELGSPWLVTDFVTVGSPLAHAALLLAADFEDLEERQKQRELPTCPPEPEVDDSDEEPTRPRYAYRPWFPDRRSEDPSRLRRLHGGAPFAVTRWTNLFFWAHGGLCGDIVAGPLRPPFGLGIRDVEVHSDYLGGLGRFWLGVHNQYWRAEDTADGQSLTELRRAMRLDDWEPPALDAPPPQAPVELAPGGGASTSAAVTSGAET